LGSQTPQAAANEVGSSMSLTDRFLQLWGEP
jgi:hypothetical protein